MNIAILFAAMNPRQRARLREISHAYAELKAEIEDPSSAWTDGRVSKHLQSSLDPRRIKETL